MEITRRGFGTLASASALALSAGGARAAAAPGALDVIVLGAGSPGSTPPGLPSSRA